MSFKTIDPPDQEQLMVWNAVNCQHETTIPLPIGKHEFKFVVFLAHCKAKFLTFFTCKTLIRFVVDGEWHCSDAHPLAKQHSCKEEQNNIVHVLPSTR